jgi:hypothetical protein
MKKAIPAKQKSVGRPATGVTPMMGFRAEPALRAAIVRWAENQPDMPTLSEATRRLVELGLKVKAPTGPSRNALRASLAAELAAKAIDGIVDPSAPPEERAQRRRRLTKGPLEFREDRVDLPKAKGK